MKALFRRTSSLRLRWLLVTLLAAAFALAAAGVLLAGLFRAQVMRQFESTLIVQLDQLTAQLEFDAAGQPRIDPAALSDPRWLRPYAGLYWQIDRLEPGPPRLAALRSRSLWDAALALPIDDLPEGIAHRHDTPGPNGKRLRAVERIVHADDSAARWRLIVAADADEPAQAALRFNGSLALTLAVLLALLGTAALAQVALGLAPLRALQRALSAVREGRSERLDGRFPAEIQPLIDDFNRVLDRNAEVVARARTQAGNLAHAIKTPLAALAQAAEAVRQASGEGTPSPAGQEYNHPPFPPEEGRSLTPPPSGEGLGWGPAAVPQATATDLHPCLPPEGEGAKHHTTAGDAAALAKLVQEQVALAQRQVDWHLARSRAAAAQGLAGVRAELTPVLAGLLRLFERIYAERGLELDNAAVAPGLVFAGEEQDLQEMLGNLLDNACKWAHRRVQISAALEAPTASDAPNARGTMLCLCIADDGPGIDAAQRETALARGARIDESAPGSGLGLSIVQELVRLYGGTLQLDRSPLGGLKVVIELPALLAPRR